MNYTNTQLKSFSGKKIYAICLLTLTILFMAACNKGDDDDDGDDYEDITGTPVVIMGDVDFATTDAVKVLAISSTDRHKIADIANNSFSITLDNGKPWGLIFLNSSDQPLGILSLGNGIETLPLHYVTTGVDSIDLQAITRNGNIFTPAHNPIGNEIILTPQQIIMIAGMDNYLAAILNNPDVDGNGIIDVLEDKFYRLSVLYFIKPGRFEQANLTPTFDPNTVIEGFRLVLTAEDNSFPETVYFTGPAGSFVSNTPSESYQSFDSHRVYGTQYIYDPMAVTSLYPPGGIYTIQYGSKTLTFELGDQTYVEDNIVYPFPTLTLNGNGTMNKIDWTYEYPTGTVNYDLSALMRDLMIQIEGYGNKCSDHQDANRLYDSPRLEPSVTSHIFSCQNIDWGTPLTGNYIERVMMTYEDHYGQSYVVMYERNY